MQSGSASAGGESHSTAKKSKESQKRPRRKEPDDTVPAPPEAGVPNPVYSFLWVNPSSHTACLILEFIRESDAVAFDLAAHPNCEWNTEPSLTTKQVLVKIPGSFHSVHWSPLPNHRMRYAFTKPGDADKLNEHILFIGSKSFWSLEGMGAFYCVDV